MTLNALATTAAVTFENDSSVAIIHALSKADGTGTEKKKDANVIELDQ